MSRFTVFLGFWLVGFALGFFGYLAFPAVAEYLMAVFTSEIVVGAFISGLAGSIITTAAVLAWSHLSRT